jgi:hypothetical protein
MSAKRGTRRRSGRRGACYETRSATATFLLTLAAAATTAAVAFGDATASDDHATIFSDTSAGASVTPYGLTSAKSSASESKNSSVRAASATVCVVGLGTRTHASRG